MARTRRAPVKAAVVIASGQLISLQYNNTLSRYEWTLGFEVGVSSGVPFIASQDSTQFDVLEAGSLVGLSTAGQFEVSTAFFKTGDTYNEGVLLTFDAVTGDVKATTAGSGALTVGRVSNIRGPKDLGAGSPPSDSSSVNQDVIRFETISDINPA